jgi:hypothetical protein
MRRKAIAWMAAFPAKTRKRAEEIRFAGAVQHLESDRDGAGVQARVQGTLLYSVSLRYHAKRSWTGECTCPMAFNCKHAYAAMLVALSAWPAEETAEFSPVDVPAPAREKTKRFAEVLAEKLGRTLDAAEAKAARTVDSLYRDYRNVDQVPLSKAESVSGAVTENRWEWTTIQVWPYPPASPWEAWLYVAAHLRRKNLKLLPGFAAVTDWAEVDELVHAWERQLSVDRWRDWLQSTARLPETSAAAESDLRVRLTEQDVKLEWRKSGAADYKAVPQATFQQWAGEAQAGRLPSPESAARIFGAFNTGYGALPSLPYQQRDATRILNQLLRDASLAERIVGPGGVPLVRRSETLAWRADVTEGGETDYRLSLVLPDGSAPPPPLTVVDGAPSLYVSEQGIFPAPPVGNLRPEAKPITIPAEAMETPDGVTLLERLRVEPPARLASRVRTVRLRLVFRCRLEASQLDSSERLVVEVLGEVAPGVFPEVYHRDGWVVQSKVETARPDEILRVDRSALAPAADALAALKPTWWAYDREWHKPVGRKFAEQFSEWIATVPPEATLLLDPILASFRDGPVRATVKLEVEESGIDWFDLRVALDIADTTLTKAEIKALLDARGGFVRLGAKGWHRLRFDLSEEDQAQLADLGLSANDLDGGKQRLHALQLAGKSATKRLLNEEHTQRIERRAEEIRTRVAPAIPPALKAELRPYQVEGFHFLAYLSTNRFGGILADDMGLGKTLQTLSWLLWLRGAEGVTDPKHQRLPSLVVCPKSVVDNWRSESARFAPGLRVAVLPRGANARELAAARADADLVVTNYAQLRILEAEMIAAPWLAVILDEAQAIKNPEAATARAAWSLKAAHRLALSGTPIENRLLDLWSIMQFAMPGVLGHRTAFGKMFDQRSDPFARRRLAARVRPFVIRRTKSEVARDLPERIEEDLLCELDGDQGTLYRAELKRARAALLKIDTKAQLDKARFNILTSLMRLRQICCHPALVGAKAKKKANEDQPESAKLAALLDLLEPLIEEGHKVLVFSQFVQMLDLIRAEFVARDWHHFVLTGATEDRGPLVAEFQKTEGPAVFLISLRAGGFGLNLTAASYVVLFDPWWNPAVENQAIDRTHRIGQKNTVIAYRLLMKETIEEKIRGLQKQKSALASDVLGEEAFARTLTLDDFRFLFEG